MPGQPFLILTPELRDALISKTISQKIVAEHITSLVFNKVINSKRRLIALFEAHNEEIPNYLIQLISTMFSPDAIAFELPLEYTTELEKMRSLDPKTKTEAEVKPTEAFLKPQENQDSDNSDGYEEDEGDEGDDEDMIQYKKQLKELTTLIPCPLVAVDAPQGISENLFGSEQQQDAVRNLFMAQTLTQFIPGQRFITINGRCHYADLFKQLTDIDPNLCKIAVFYIINPLKTEASIQIPNQANPRCIITSPNVEALKTPVFHKQLKDTLSECFRASSNSLFSQHKAVLFKNPEGTENDKRLRNENETEEPNNGKRMRPHLSVMED